MFARVLDEMKEPFTGSTTKSIQNYFSNTLPNIIYNNDAKQDLVRLTEVSNTRIASNQDTLRQKWLQTDNNKELLKQKEADCKDNKGLDPFDRLTYLNTTEDATSRLRCGWIYNKTNPNLGGGALGLEEGPISSKAPGVWNWDLKLATEQMHIDICKDIQDCKDIDRLSLKQRCGWCERLQKAVPITKSGKVAYPWNKTGGCPASQVVTIGSKCPAKPPSDEDEETVPEPCDPLADGRTARACMLTKYKDAGCSDKGSLGRALATGSDNDYMNSIYSQKAYKVYQERSPLSLNEYGLKSGKMSMNDALNEFDRLALAASKSPSGGNALDFATRDLCLNQGEMAAFDFCTELTDSTVGPYSMDCLQKAFLKAGGQRNGLMYPSPSTMSKWNSMPNWRAVLSEMQRVKKDTGSDDSDTKYIGTKDLIDANTPNPFTCATKLLPKKINLSRGNVVGRFTTTQDYKLEFDITPRGIVGGWGSIFHFSSDGNNCCAQGQRSPAIWFMPGGLGLYVRIGDTTDGDWGYTNIPGCQIGKKSRVVLECKGKDIKLTIDSKVHRMTQPTFRYSGPITVFASDPWHDIPNATVDNVCFQTLGNSTPTFTCSTKILPISYTPSQNRIILNNLTMTQDYTLQFDITPKAIVGNWGSIMHFTTGGDCCALGQRAPGIWFWPGSLSLLFVIGHKDDGNWHMGQIDGCALNKKSHVTLKCKGTTIVASVDNNVKTMTQPTHRYSGPLTVFGSNPWYPAANCAVENVCIELLGNSIETEPRWITAMKDGSRWKPMDGGLTNITISDTGVIFGVNSNDDIYRRDNLSSPWRQLGGKLVQIAAQGGTTVVGPNRNKQIHRGDGNGGWNWIPGGAHWMAASPKGDTWVIGTNSTQWGNYGFWRKDGSNAPNWTGVAGAAKMISVGEGEIWCMQDNGNLFRWNGGGWELKPLPAGKPATYIAVSVNGKRILSVSSEKQGGGGKIYAWHNGKWILVSGTLSQVAICDTMAVGITSWGQPWYIPLPA